MAGETGPGHPYGPWWPQLVGPGQAIDTDRYFVVAANILGGCQGSTGPSSPAPDGRPWGSRFPQLSPRDQVAAEMRLADHLGISRFHLVIGASMGGHRALEWALMSPDRVENLVVIASGARTTADQISWAYPQLAALELDPAFNDGDYYDAPPGQGPYRGLGIARAIAHATYPTAPLTSSTLVLGACHKRLRSRSRVGALRCSPTWSTTPPSWRCVSMPVPTAR